MSTVTCQREEMTMFPPISFSTEKKMVENFRNKLQQHLHFIFKNIYLTTVS